MLYGAKPSGGQFSWWPIGLSGPPPFIERMNDTPHLGGAGGGGICL